MAQGPAIVCVGHVLLDCFAFLSDAQFDFLTRDVAVGGGAVHVAPPIMETLLAELLSLPAAPPAPVCRIRRRAGGGAVNTAVAARRIGMDTQVWGSVGADANGALVADSIKTAGATFRAKVADTSTGVFLRLASRDGKNKILVSPGAAHAISGTPIEPDELPECGVFYIDGLLIDSPDWLRGLAQAAHGRHSAVAMDISTIGNAKANADGLIGFSRRYCDYVFANEEEFSALFPADIGPGALGNARWVVKLGARGARCIMTKPESVAAAGGEIVPPLAAARRSPSRKLVIIEKPTSQLSVQNSVGAGDFFSAGFLHAALSDAPVEACLDGGNSVAAKFLLAQNQED